ncbi:hypothetical protein [Paraliomyxa miuraensis]|uniref:hypothetical protein n=1 Tax=Paraliomyxa miuraensis TaxID=376150 RepID=UPI00225BB06D|nr:hypothetical protein [Paraliomyxa miuraensis]MCX4240144.1 hypothetical protein [Paraliomyxa miuraensis]
MLVPALLIALATSPPEPAAAPAAPIPPAPVAEPDPRPRPLGPVGSAGVVVGGAGLGLAIAGIVRMAQPNQTMPDPTNHEMLIVTDTRIQGGIVLGAGLAVATAGVAMLVVDLTVLRRRSARHLAVAPALSPSMAGLDLRVRFSIGRAGLP